jgi:hypothetical protein
MGVWTFTEFQTYLKLRLGGNDKFETPTNYLAIWVNAAYRDLVYGDLFIPLKKRVYFPELQTSATVATVDGTAYIAVPTDCLTITEVFDETNNKRLDWVPFRQYLAYTDRDTAASEGKPTEWVRSGSNIYLHPTPGSAYSLYVYYKKRAAVLSGSEVTAIGSEWDNVLLELATETAHRWLNDPEKAKLAKERAAEMAAAVISTYDHEDLARRERVRPDPAYHLQGRDA